MELCMDVILENWFSCLKLTSTLVNSPPPPPPPPPLPLISRPFCQLLIPLHGWRQLWMTPNQKEEIFSLQPSPHYEIYTNHFKSLRSPHVITPPPTHTHTHTLWNLPPPPPPPPPPTHTHLSPCESHPPPPHTHTFDYVISGWPLIGHNTAFYTSSYSGKGNIKLEYLRIPWMLLILR